MKITQENLALYQTIKPDKLGKSGRAYMDCIHFNGKHVQATNGRFLITDTVEEGGPKNVSLRFPKSKLEGGLPFDETFEDKGDRFVSAFGSVAEKEGGEYPDTSIIEYPEPEKVTMRIGINAAYLARIAKYLTHDSVVILEIIDPNDRIGVKGYREDSTASAILMPCKIK